jgi:hypothetical protein
MLALFSLGILLSASLQLTHAVHVYLSPAPSLYRSILSPEEATTALSLHLGLEAFEPLRDASDLTHTQENFVGQGAKNVLLITMEESDINGVY